MLERTAQFTAAQAAHGQQPVWLLDLPALGLYFSTRDPGDWITSPVYVPLIAPLSQGGISQLAYALDDSDRPQVGNVDVELINPGLVSSLLDTQRLDYTPAVLRLGFLGGTLADYLPLFNGIVRQWHITWERLTLALEANLTRYEAPFALTLGGSVLPTVPKDTRGQPVPIILGTVVDVDAVPLNEDVEGTLAEAMDTASTSIRITEFARPFPASGSVLIESETIVYAQAQVIQRGLRTLLELSGLTRAAPATHSAGVTVATTDLTQTFLVGYEVDSVDTVRVDGVVDATADVVLADDTLADQAVSVVTFDTPPAGSVTVDATGKNVEVLEAVVNGDFETGDTSGWTPGSGATATAVSTHFAGLYGLSLQGASGTLKDLYQDLTTEIDAVYQLQLAYQDRSNDSELISNNTFSGGSLTGWTVEQPTVAAVAAAAPGGSGYVLQLSNALFSDTSAATVTRTITGLTAGAVYELQLVFRYAGRGNGALTLGTTTNRAQYISIYHRRTGETSYNYDAWLAEYTEQLRSAPLTSSGSGGGLTRLYLNYEQANLGGDRWTWTTQSWQFTAADTSVYLVLLAFAATVQIASVSLKAVGDYTRTALQVGSAGTPGALIDETLPRTAMGQWQTVTRFFRATATTTRLTLRSQYGTTPYASYLDEVSVQPSATNALATIKYLLDNFTDLETDADAFAAQDQLLKGWRFAGRLVSTESVRQTLAELGAQCKTLFRENSVGQLEPVVYSYYAESQATYTPAQILRGSVALTQTPAEQLCSEILVWFGSTSSEETSPSAFSGCVYASAQGTSDTTRPYLKELCALAAAGAGISRRLEIFGKLLQSQGTAHQLLAHQVRLHSQRRTHMSCRLGLVAVHTQLGDVVSLGHALLPAADRSNKFQVRGVRIDPGQASVELACTRLAGGFTAQLYRDDFDDTLGEGLGSVDLNSGLIAFWNLDETSGTRVDATGNGHDLTPNGTTSSAAGHLGTALSLPGHPTGGHVYRAESDLGIGIGHSAFTIAGWWYPTNASTNVAVSIHKDGAGVGGVAYICQFAIVGGEVRFLAGDQGDSPLKSIPGGISTNTWHFLVGWYTVSDGIGQVNVQMDNGTIYSSTTFTPGTGLSGPFQLSLGRNFTTDGSSIDWAGRLDSIGIWNRALTADERTALYNGGTGLSHDLPSFSTLLDVYKSDSALVATRSDDDPLSGSASAVVRRGGSTASGPSLHCLVVAGQRRGLTMGKLRAVFRIDAASGTSDSGVGLLFMQSQADLTSTGSAYAAVLRTSSTGGTIGSFALLQYTSGIAQPNTGILVEETGLSIVAGTPVALEVEWVLDPGDAGGLHVIGRRGVQEDFSDLSTAWETTLTSTLLTQPAGEGPFVFWRGTGELNVSIDEVTLFEVF